jgi:MFS family permease
MSSPWIRVAPQPRPAVGPRAVAGRWVGLLSGVVLMMALAGVLFVWPLLRVPPGAGLAEPLAAAENAFAAFIIAEALFVPLEAWLGDRSPRWLLAAAGAALVGVGALAGAAAAGPLARLGWSALGGVGAGLAYGATVAKALRHLTDRRALCVGVTAAACVGVLALALGAAWAVSTPRALAVLVVLGAAQAVVIVIATLVILYPPPEPPSPGW